MPATTSIRAGGVVLSAIIVACLVGVVALSLARARRAQVVQEEQAAEATLKAVVFPAEVRFQKDAVRDDDHDGIGEFGALGELAHDDTAIPADVAAGAASGYRFAVWLPLDQRSATAGPPAAGAPGADLREAHLLAYAWPAADGVGRLVFALDQDGRVYAAPAVPGGDVPTWSAALAEPRWGAAVRWAEWPPAP